MTQRLECAQELIQTLVNLLSLPLPPNRMQVQAALDMAKARLAAIEMQAQAVAAPLVVPQFVPPAIAPAAITPTNL